MSKCVMVVEDNELNMKLFNDLLEANGYRTIKTMNGLEALDLAARRGMVGSGVFLADTQVGEVLLETVWSGRASAGESGCVVEAVI